MDHAVVRRTVFFSLYHKKGKKSRPAWKNGKRDRIFGIYDKTKSSVSWGLTHRGGAFEFGVEFKFGFVELFVCALPALFTLSPLRGAPPEGEP